VINVKDRKLEELHFVQAGVDRAMRQRGHRPLLKARRLEAALGFPCESDAAFVNSLLKSRSDLRNDAKLSAAARELSVTHEGKELDCVMESLAVMVTWPRLFDPATTVASRASCQAGISLLDGLMKANPRDERLRTTMSRFLNQAADGQQAGDPAGCLGGVFGGRAYFWDRILRDDIDRPLDLDAQRGPMGKPPT